MDKALILKFALGLWARRWVALSCAWAVAMVGALVVATLKDQYRSEARVFVDTKSLLDPLLSGLAVTPNLDAQVEIIRRTLLSRPNLEQLVRMADLDVGLSGIQEDALLRELQARVSVTSQGGGLYGVSFTHESPETARRVVESILGIFVEQNVGSNRRDLESAQRFIQEQIDDYERQLRDQEARMAQFRRENMEELNARTTAVAQLQSAEAGVTRLEAERESAAWSRDQLRVDLASTPATLPAGSGGASGAADRVSVLRAELARLKSRLTDQHPDVVAAQRQLDLAEREMAGEGPASVGTVPNPAYAQLQAQLRAAERQVQSLDQRIANAREQVTALQRLNANVPEIEVKLIQLNRDYEVLRSNYASLLERRESARLTERVDTQANRLDIRIIDPPLTPLQPTSPNRPLSYAAVLIVALGAGVGLAFALSFLNDAFVDPSQLKSKYDIPVLGAVSVHSSVAYQRRQKVGYVGLALATACLLVVMGAFMALQVRYDPGEAWQLGVRLKQWIQA